MERIVQEKFAGHTTSPQRRSISNGFTELEMYSFISHSKNAELFHYFHRDSNRSNLHSIFSYQLGARSSRKSAAARWSGRPDKHPQLTYSRTRASLSFLVSSLRCFVHFFVVCASFGANFCRSVPFETAAAKQLGDSMIPERPWPSRLLQLSVLVQKNWPTVPFRCVSYEVRRVAQFSGEFLEINS